MKKGSLVTLAVYVTFAGIGNLHHLQAQEPAEPSAATKERCVNWIKATVPGVFSLVPEDFCSGILRGEGEGPGAWYSLKNCGPLPEQSGSAPPEYCASSGQIRKTEAWAAGFRSATSDGHELLDGAARTGNGSDRIAATFFTRTPVWMGSLRIPAGMYDLMPSKSGDRWSLSVSRQDGQQNPGKVEMQVADYNGTAGRGPLAITTSPWGEHCPGPALDWTMRELHFIYGNTDVFVCVRPDQIPQTEHENLSQK